MLMQSSTIGTMRTPAMMNNASTTSTVSRALKRPLCNNTRTAARSSSSRTLLMAFIMAVAATSMAEAYTTASPLSSALQRIPLMQQQEHKSTQRRRISLYSSVSDSESSLSDPSGELEKKKIKNKENHIHEYCTEIDFELHVGRALDVLRKDYADRNLLVQDPDYSLYDPQMDFTDPSGVALHGLGSYQNAFRLLHALVKFLYCPDSSGFTRVSLCYDPTKRSIRIHWNAVLQPRQIFFGSRTLKHVDGISVYELDRRSGAIVRHVLENLIINNQAISPKEGVVEALSRYHGHTVPSYYSESNSGSPGKQKQQHDDLFTVPFLQWNTGGTNSLFSPVYRSQESNNHGNNAEATLPSPSSSSRLQSMEASQSGNGNSEGGAAGLEIDWDALERKNTSRKKFGMKPLSPEEFVQLQSTVQEMDAAQQVKRQEQLRQKAEKERLQQQQEQQQKNGNVFDKLFGNVLKDTCEDNFDCQRPQVCCDFGFKKMCCASGSPVLGQQWATVPVPQGTEDFPQNRPPPRY